jgi:hypothetical protein
MLDRTGEVATDVPRLVRVRGDRDRDSTLATPP